MTVRMQITMEPALQRVARKRAAELGISIAEYVRRAIAGEVGAPRHKPDVSVLFDLCSDGPPTDVARDKDAMLAEAVWAEQRRKVSLATGRIPKKARSRRARPRGR